MIVLGIDTSCGVCSAAIYNGKLLANSEILDIHKQAAQTSNLVSKTLSDASLSINDLDFLSVTVGPGSFTGIRIGISLIQGIASVINKPILGLTTLEVMAYKTTGKLKSIMDAGKGEVYAQDFLNGNAISDIKFEDPNNLNLEKCIGVYKDMKQYPSAINVVKLAHDKLSNPQLVIPTLKPLYIREPDAVVKLTERSPKS